MSAIGTAEGVLLLTAATLLEMADEPMALRERADLLTLAESAMRLAKAAAFFAADARKRAGMAA